VRLDEQGRLYQALMEKVLQIVQVAGVVALEFIARARFIERAQGKFNILEGIPKHQVAGILEHLRLPIVTELLEAPQHRE
jgi:hypothetical protein